MRMNNDNTQILRVIEAYDFKDRLWIFVELMDDALTGFIEEMQNHYTENVCKYILHQTLAGVNFLHSRHVIHRDIKSDNILVNSKGDIKLADFGYSVQLTKQQAGRVSKVGTVCWMAPELIQGERKYDTKIDVWSVGIFAMELANGDPPYISEPQSRVIYNIVRNNPPPIREKWSNDFQRFVSACLTKDPALRPTAESLLDHPFLKNALGHKKEFAEIFKDFM